MAISRKSLAVIISMAAALIIVAFPAPAHATLQSDLDEANAAAEAAKSQYDEAVAAQSELQSQIDQLNADIADAEARMPELQANANKAVRDMYVFNGDFVGVLESLLCGETLDEVLTNIECYERISEWRESEVSALTSSKAQLESDKAAVEVSKAAQDEEVAKAETAKQDAIEAQGEARDALAAAQASNQTIKVSSSGSSERAATSSSWSDEESAKAYIVGKESGGNYQARNGRYYGAYQLTESYLGGDYSPENQDAVAQRYVEGRYGSWVGAAQFWDSHGWY